MAQVDANDAVACLGDMVGYGANPNECVRLLRDATKHAVLGNHDLAALENYGTEFFNDAARTAIEWTQKVLDEERVERVPVWEVLKRQPKQVVLSALLRLPEQGPGFVFGAFIFTYGTTQLHMTRNFLLTAVICQTFLGFLWVVVAGTLSDYVGRKNMYMFGCAFMGVFGFIYFVMLDTGVPWVIFLAVAISLIPVMTEYGPEAALIAESFTPRLRYSGTSIGYQLASIIAGGPAPLIATWLFARYHSSLPIALYILLTAIVGFISTAMLTDYTNKDISEEYAGV